MNDDIHMKAFFHGCHSNLECYETIGRLKISFKCGQNPGISECIDSIEEATGVDRDAALHIYEELKQEGFYIFEHNEDMISKFRNHAHFLLQLEHVPIPIKDRTKTQLYEDCWNPLALTEIERREWENLTPEEQYIEIQIRKLDAERDKLIDQIPEHRQGKYIHLGAPVG